jgi:hypothetical protein
VQPLSPFDASIAPFIILSSTPVIGFAPEKVARDSKVFCMASSGPRDNKAVMTVA